MHCKGRSQEDKTCAWQVQEQDCWKDVQYLMQSIPEIPRISRRGETGKACAAQHNALFHKIQRGGGSWGKSLEPRGVEVWIFSGTIHKIIKQRRNGRKVFSPRNPNSLDNSIIPVSFAVHWLHRYIVNTTSNARRSTSYGNYFLVQSRGVITYVSYSCFKKSSSMSTIAISNKWVTLKWTTGF